MKLHYWVSRCLDDSEVYNIRTRTKKEAVAERQGREDRYGPITKVTVDYKDGFDLMMECSHEDHHWWE